MIANASHLEEITKFVANAEKHPKTASFALQSVARELLPNERIKICYRYHVPLKNVEVWHNAEKQNAYYCGLMKCGMQWVCPLCSARLSEQRRQTVRAAIDNSKERLIPLMVTYTARHDARMPLKTLLDAMLASYRSMRQARLWRVYKEEYMIVGECRAMEITYGASGWHPHFHVLLFVGIEMLKVIGENNEYNLSQRLCGPLEAHLSAMWIHELRKHGLDALVGPALNVRTEWEKINDYLTKQGSSMPNLADRWGVAEELTKSNRKKSRGDNYNVWDLLLLAFYAGQPYSTKFVEYYHATKGKSALQWTPGLLARLTVTEETDDQALDVQPAPEDILLLSITSEQWRVILQAGAEGKLLDECATGDYMRLERFLAKIGAAISD